MKQIRCYRLIVRLIVIAWGFFPCIVSHEIVNSFSHEIAKVFHHKSGIELKNDITSDIELGNVVFYFVKKLKKPIINFIPMKNSTNLSQKAATFIFPKATIKDAVCQKMIKRINRETGHGYALRIEKIKVPIDGIRLTIQYDPKKVSFRYTFCKSIGNYEGVIFSFYNEYLINKLEQRADDIVRTACSKKKMVVIDCGHGGSDFGAIGCYGLKEKEITLSLGMKLSGLLKKNGFDVLLTRSQDQFIPLDKRTAIANRCKDADLLVSLHANSSTQPNISGIETFCLSDSLFHSSVFFCSHRQMNVICSCLKKKFHKSFLLAQSLQKNIIQTIKQKKIPVIDRRVKHAVSQLLLGANMPAALIEVGFLSNKNEARLLQTQTYQTNLVRGICKGLIDFINIYLSQ